MRFVTGLFIGLLASGGYVGYQLYIRKQDPCLSRCGEGTRCEEGMCLAIEEKVLKKKKRKKRRRRRWRRRPKRGGGDSASLRQPTAAELQVSVRGPVLNKTDFVDLTSPGQGGRELSSTEIDKIVRPLDRRIVGCIDNTRKDVLVNKGKVLVGFRIERSGQVKKVRVSAPMVLQSAGLYACIRRLITGLRFPMSTSAQIVSYPYKLY